MKRILVIDGNTAAIRAKLVEQLGYATGEGYAGVLRSIDSHLSIDVVRPADCNPVLPTGMTLGDYQGVAVTGSALNVYAGGAAVERQLALVRAVFAAGIPLFGSCWGLQVAVTVLDGEIVRNPRGREFGFARRIVLTASGRAHPMYQRKPTVFEAPTVHLDTIARLPPGATVLAENEYGIQALTVTRAATRFWGVQYHPEYEFLDVAAVAERYGQRLVEEQFFGSLADIGAFVADMRQLSARPDDRPVLWKYGLGSAAADWNLRTLELRNWLSAI